MIIVGASSYIGQHFYKFLQNKGEHVIGTYFNNIKPGLIKFDLLVRGGYSLFENCNYVVVLSAHARIKFCEEFPVEAYDLNVSATKELLKYLDTNKIPSLWLSSDLAEHINVMYGRFKREVEYFIDSHLKYCRYIRPTKVTDATINDLCWEMYKIIKEPR